MITKRWAAQIGLLSAAAVLVTCIGVLISQGGDNGRPTQSSPIANVSHGQSAPISLSAASSSSAVAQH
jgi:hypothetical protein